MHTCTAVTHVHTRTGAHIQHIYTCIYTYSTYTHTLHTHITHYTHTHSATLPPTPCPLVCGFALNQRAPPRWAAGNPTLNPTLNPRWAADNAVSAQRLRADGTIDGQCENSASAPLTEAGFHRYEEFNTLVFGPPDHSPHSGNGPGRGAGLFVPDTVGLTPKL